MISFRTLLLASMIALGSGQVPGLGGCPKYSLIQNFDLNRYTGVWYEYERFFTILEAGRRCVRSNYTLEGDGKFRVYNEITGRLSGNRRVVKGVVQKIGIDEEGKLLVTYYTLPIPIETQFSVLDTDYNNFSVAWSCSRLGPINTQHAWIMTRERIPSGPVLEKAYNVLRKYNISRTFFVKTDQKDCAFENEETVQSAGFRKEEESVKVEPEPKPFVVPKPSAAPLPVPAPVSLAPLKEEMEKKKPEIAMVPADEKKPEAVMKPEEPTKPLPIKKEEMKPVEKEPMKEK